MKVEDDYFGDSDDSVYTHRARSPEIQIEEPRTEVSPDPQEDWDAYEQRKSDQKEKGLPGGAPVTFTQPGQRPVDEGKFRKFLKDKGLYEIAREDQRNRQDH